MRCATTSSAMAAKSLMSRRLRSPGEAIYYPCSREHLRNCAPGLAASWIRYYMKQESQHPQTPSPKPKDDISQSYYLTPSEISALRQDRKEAHEEFQRIMDEMGVTRHPDFRDK